MKRIILSVLVVLSLVLMTGCGPQFRPQSSGDGYQYYTNDSSVHVTPPSQERDGVKNQGYVETDMNGEHKEVNFTGFGSGDWCEEGSDISMKTLGPMGDTKYSRYTLEIETEGDLKGFCHGTYYKLVDGKEVASMEEWHDKDGNTKKLIINGKEIPLTVPYY